MPRGISHFDGRKRAFVKVQDGCILKCTYCIIPHVRPGLASRSPDDIEDEVRRLVGNGYREIVAQRHPRRALRGRDDTRKSGLCLRSGCGTSFASSTGSPESGGCGCRVSRAEVNDDFISAAADREHLCPQFHPPCKAVRNAVLLRMRRRYSAERFLEKVARMRERLDRPAFTTDMIVGFPGESEEDFEQSLSACRQAGFMKIHVFPYSACAGQK